MTVNVIITFKAKPEMLVQFNDIMTSVKRDLPQVEGCSEVKVFRDKEDEHVFTLLETWDSEVLHKKHIEGVVESGGWEAIASHLQCDPSSSYFSQL